jgi:hypothetical protein
MPQSECVFIKVEGLLMCYNQWVHRVVDLKEDIHCDLFLEWVQWMV